MIRRALMILIVLAGFVPLSGVCEGSAKVDYELQERCGKQADEFFKREYGKSGVFNTEDGQAIAGYRNHYNKKLNKCFFLLTYQDLPYKTKKNPSSTVRTLYDINENKEYGEFFQRLGDNHPTECKVSGKLCQSEKEWDALISPYMDE